MSVYVHDQVPSQTITSTSNSIGTSIVELDVRECIPQAGECVAQTKTNPRPSSIVASCVASVAECRRQIIHRRQDRLGIGDRVLLLRNRSRGRGLRSALARHIYHAGLSILGHELRVPSDWRAHLLQLGLRR